MASLQAPDILTIYRRLSGALPQAPDDDAAIDSTAIDSARLAQAIRDHHANVQYYPGVYEQGAALFDSLLNESPFPSHQAATAFMALYTFLRLNGLDLDVEFDSVLVDIVERGAGRVQVAALLEEHARPIKQAHS